MQVQLIPIEQLNMAEYNPRIMPAAEMEALKKSLKLHGFVQPVVINSNPDRKNIVIGGHQRIRAAKELCIESVPCVFVEKTEEEEKILNLALNRIDGQWDEKKLGELIYDLRGSDIFSASGFTETETSKILDSLMSPFDLSPDDEEEELPEEPISQRGEVYELGEHRLICGDSSDPEIIEKLMNGEKADMIWTNPPYNVNYHSTGDTLTDGQRQKIENDNLSPEEFERLVDGAFFNMMNNLKVGGSLYICFGWSSYPQFLNSLKKLGFEFSGVIIWVKNAGGFGFSDYKKKHEWIAKGKKVAGAEKKKGTGILYGWKTGAKHEFYGGRDEFDVWEMPRKAVTKYVHPTEKPDWLPMRAIKNSTRRGQIVLDLFSGSGSVMEAAEKTGRRAFMVEYDPKFCDIIRKRYEHFKLKEQNNT